MKLSEQGVIILYRVTAEGEAELEREVTDEVAKLEEREMAARAIMEKFVFKVDEGRARSKETYAEMKEWLGR